ncbi:phytoene desaturase family protein [Planctomonas psychrotolerans]|uniref:phytoene desaturase family protein n=1 Tax=Planctomonas psychrotolerans TaxID=2528712 RepID=UPI00123A0E66|nr:NAD(P)/FAD-dependent oxidoreductase [Planctomonas psychrotolerans]
MGVRRTLADGGGTIVDTVDVIVVGAGPNGLAAAVTMARAGLSVRVYEKADVIGGGSRTAELTLPGFRHDICSAVHPMAYASAFFRRFGLAERIPFVLPEVSYGHPLDGGRAGIAYRDIERTVESLGVDGHAWKTLMGPLARHADQVARTTGSSLLQAPPHPLTFARFGIRALEQGTVAWNLRWKEDVAPAMLAGVAAHAIRPMPSLATAAGGLMLGTYAHDRGWPIPVGGSQSIVDAMAADVVAHGGEIVTGTEITSLAELPKARAVLFDVSPRALVRIAGSRMPARYERALKRFRYGNGAAKVDYALSGPVPWTNPELHRASTLHVGGTRAELVAAEKDVARGRHSERPYVLASQPTTFDPSRAPEGKHVLWAYAHVPQYSTVDQTEVVTAQIERFAPGFRDLILASSSTTGIEMERYNPNYIGGDIAVGAPSMRQLVARPVFSADPWRTPMPGVYLCSSSTPPGPGVHGLAGWHAAASALRHEFGMHGTPALGIEQPPMQTLQNSGAAA